MSWQVAMFSGLALVLVAGFAWYERSRPPARVVALVAALAALAIAGRLALAPVPNVVATTDIVLITGFALGAGPGFAVGALAALVSNLWLGHGPWTPWQMAGWGLVGMGGAALARLTARRIGRIGLAVACGLAGLAYGALLDLSVMVGYGGEQSLDRYLALSARGVPFNVAHAAGNVALALVAGPALVRMIARYRRRFEFTWPLAARGPAGAPLAALAVALVAVGTAAGSPPAGAAGSASAWLERTQNGDGGFAAEPGGRSSPAMTGWATLGLEASGLNPLDARSSGNSAIGYLRVHAGGIGSTGDLERTILALVGAGVDPRRFAGHDLVAELRGRRAGDGSFGGEVNLTAFGVLALDAAGDPRAASARSAAWLRRAQNRDGGWGFQPGAASDPDSTGAALQALALTGARTALGRGVRFLAREQRPDGGFALLGQRASNVQSTAWAVQGLLAAGRDPGGLERGGSDPFDFLAARREPDGHYSYSAASDQTPVWVTAQALLAVNRKPFPLAEVARAPGTSAAAPGVQSEPGLASPDAPDAEPGRRSAKSKGSERGAGVAVEDDRRDRRGADRAAAAVAAPADTETDGGPDRGRYALAALGGLALALGGGFLWYRHRLG